MLRKIVCKTSRKERNPHMEKKIQSIGRRKEKRMPLTIMELGRVRKNHFARGMKEWSCPHLKGMGPKVRQEG